MNTKEQIKHEESGCTDYLQHTWQSCPMNCADARNTTDTTPIVHNETFVHLCPKCGSSALETNVKILVCDGVNRKQAFRRGSHLIGYGDTELQAVENLIDRENYYKLQDTLYKK